MMRIFVAIPVYDGKLPVQTVACLLTEQTLANEIGDNLQVSFLPSCSVPAAGRNQLVQDFLSSDCERLVFLDADVTFEMGALLKLAHRDQELVGGAYRYKHANECYPVMWLDQTELWADASGLLEVAALPTGFMSISRSVFEKFRLAHPGREYEHCGKKAYCYFQMVFKDGHMHSDDTYFCREWREAGGKVFLDPEIALSHWDFNPKEYSGHIGRWLKNRTEGEANA